MRRSFSILLPVVFLSFFACAQDQDAPKRGPSTPEERKRFVALVQKLEQSPLDKGLWPEVKWANKWLDDIPDVNVSICPAPLGSLDDENYKYRGQVFVQFTFGMAVYLIQHPDKAADREAQYLAGVQEALRTYRSILKAEPHAQSAAMDQLVAKDAEGTLNDFVREAAKLCEDTQRS